MAENIENNGCSQRDTAEHEGYVKAQQEVQEQENSKQSHKHEKDRGGR